MRTRSRHPFRRAAAVTACAVLSVTGLAATADAAPPGDVAAAERGWVESTLHRMTLEEKVG